MTLEVSVLLVYALLLIVGGAIGYAKAKSKASLIAGSVSGGISFIAAGWTWSGGPGAYLGIALAVAMTIVFGIRLRKTGKFMPAGLLLVVSVLTAVILVVGRAFVS